MENIQISYDGERVEITFKKGEGVSVCGNSKSWDDLVVPCCVDMECDLKSEPLVEMSMCELKEAIESVRKITADEKEKEGTLAHCFLSGDGQDGDAPLSEVLKWFRAVRKASSAEEKKKSVTAFESRKQKAREAADHIDDAFAWVRTREGHDYWSKVFWRLRQIAEDGVL